MIRMKIYFKNNFLLTSLIIWILAIILSLIQFHGTVAAQIMREYSDQKHYKKKTLFTVDVSDVEHFLQRE